MEITALMGVGIEITVGIRRFLVIGAVSVGGGAGVECRAWDSKGWVWRGMEITALMGVGIEITVGIR